MITEEQYKIALSTIKVCQESVNQYHREQQEAFDLRLKENPIFTDEELTYSAVTLCPCGHGLAYPKKCGAFHYWDCSAILKGVADKSVKHEAQLPFTFYNIKGENDRNGTTRGVFKPRLARDTDK